MNPFRYGQVVSSHNYCRRPDLEKKLQSYFLSGQNTYIEGERRTGKTSLIFQTVAHTRSKWLIYIDLLEVRTVEDINKRILNGIAKANKGHNLLSNIIKSLTALRPVVSFDPITGSPSISIDASLQLQPESLEGMLDLFSGREFKNVVIAFDEFQDIRNLANAGQALAVMRSKIQFLNTVPFVFCGSIRHEMHMIFNDPESPFFKSALPLNVGSIDRTEFSAFIVEKFRKGKREIPDVIVNKVLQITNDNPGDSQQLCSAIYDVSNELSQVSDTTINEALQYLFAEERKGYEVQLARLTAIQLKCLTTVARIGGRNTSSSEFIKTSGVALPTTIRKALTRLVELKILFMNEGEFRFVNPFFAQWLVLMNY
jgi:AAA+ ATPase superfamily predicted ATPase